MVRSRAGKCLSLSCCWRGNGSAPPSLNILYRIIGLEGCEEGLLTLDHTWTGETFRVFGKNQLWLEVEGRAEPETT